MAARAAAAATRSCHDATPAVLRDPRFEAGRTLIQQGMARDGAIDIFSTLVEECIAKYGDSAIETSPAFFEYGNALLRAYLAVPLEDDDDGDDDGEEEEEEVNEGNEEVDDTGNKDKLREAAAASAEARLNTTGDKLRSDPVVSSTNTIQEELKSETLKVARQQQNACTMDPNAPQIKEEGEEGDKDEDSNDLRLSLEMMENAYSIMDNYHQTQTNVSNVANDKVSNGRKYLHWTKDQIPRVLLGIGDCLSALQRHADAADVYSRALEWRQNQLQELLKEETLAQLQCQRRVCEATILIAEELLACPDGHDVITTETKSLIVKAEERIEYARGYYDKARDSLQDTVYLLGKLASKNIDLGTEKEDVCFLATMIMGVGETLAALDEEEAENQTEEPVKKKPKPSS